MTGTDAAEDWRRLREMCADVVKLRRGDHHAARLRIEQERLELERAESKEHMKKLFWEWAQIPEHKESICRDESLTPEERRQRIGEIYGRPPEPLGSALTPSEPNPVKPNWVQPAPLSPNQIQECQSRKPMPSDPSWPDACTNAR